MTYEIQALPDFIVHTRFKIGSATATTIPAGGIRYGVIDLTDLKYDERPDLAVHFGIILECDMVPVAGILFEMLNIRPRVESKVRLDAYMQLHVRVTNFSTSAIGLADSFVTVAGIAAAPRRTSYAAQPTLSTGAAGGIIVTDLVAKDAAGVVISSEWARLSGS